VAATIELGGERYTAEGLKWSGPDPDVVGMLDGYAETNTFGPSYPDPDLRLAQIVVRELGAKLVGNTPPPDDGPAGRVY
jgi:hypothetical protein